MSQMPRSLVESGFSTPQAVEAEAQEPEEQQEVVEETTQQAEEPKAETKTTRRKTEAK